MKKSAQYSFENCVNKQVSLLNAGKPLEAFDAFFGAAGVMFSNDKLFASGNKEAREKQEPFISAAVSINGLIAELKVLTSQEICIFRNMSSFTSKDNKLHQINGLCWQKWRYGKIEEERYYDGDHMNKLIENGILKNPALLVRP